MAKSGRRSVTDLRTTQPPLSPPARDKITVLLDGELIERVRDAAWHLRLTISDIAGPAPAPGRIDAEAAYRSIVISLAHPTALVNPAGFAPQLPTGMVW